MNSIKNYIWTEALNVPEKAFKDWKEKGNNQNFLAWSLAQKVIDRRKYFDWAVDFYKTPILQNIFFEQNLMNLNQWKKVKDLHEWGVEIAPVFLWEGTIFIGCLEVPKNHKSWTFKHRLVLVTDLALRMHWKHIKNFKELIKPSSLKTNVNSPIQSKSQFPESEKNRFSSTEDTISERTHQTQEDGLDMKNNFTIDLPPEEDPIKKIEYAQLSKDKNQQPIKSSLNNITPITNQPIKKESAQTNKDETEMDAQLSTNTSIMIKKLESYDDLFNQTKSHFAGSLILKNKNKNLFPVNWTGRIDTTLNETTKIADLNDFSIFKVVGRGFPYHGFVIESEANKKFFNIIGWTQYPKHVTAIPIKNKEDQLDLIFLGLSVTHLNRQSIQKIEQNVINYFLKQKSEKVAA